VTNDSCDRCGGLDGTHVWVDGDCILPHRTWHVPASAGHVCRWCVDRHKTWLREITDLYATLQHVILPGSVPDNTADHKHVKGAEAPAPIRLEAWALLYDTARLHSTGKPSDLPDIPSVLCGWAQNLFDDTYQGTTAPSALSGAAAALYAQAETVARRPWVDEYDADLGWCRDALRRVHGVSDNPRPVGRCPSLNGAGIPCGGALWPDRSGAMAVQCARCDRQFGELFLRHLGGMLTA
jgi:hypothetical protein